MNNPTPDNPQPLERLEDWDDFVGAVYPTADGKAREDYRNYDKPARESRAIFFVRLYFAKIAFGIIT